MNSKSQAMLKRVGIGCLMIWAFGCRSTPPAQPEGKNSEIHYKLGLAYLNENPPKLQKAYVELIKAVQADPQDVDVHYALGHVYFQRQEYEKSVETFRQVLALDPQYTRAHNYLGSAYEALGKEEEAILAYQAALQDIQYETPQMPHWNLGMLYFRRGAYDLALVEFQEVRRIEPNNGSVLTQLGETYIKAGALDKARPFFEEATKVAPQDYRTHYRLAQFYVDAGLSAKAVESFQKVIELAPESHEADDARQTVGTLKNNNL